MSHSWHILLAYDNYCYCFSQITLISAYPTMHVHRKQKTNTLTQPCITGANPGHEAGLLPAHEFPGFQRRVCSAQSTGLICKAINEAWGQKQMSPQRAPPCPSSCRPPSAQLSLFPAPRSATREQLHQNTALFALVSEIKAASDETPLQPWAHWSQRD